MAENENCLLEIIDTGPCTHRELQQVAPALIIENTGFDTSPREVLDMLDRLTSLGMVGFTGVSLEYVVPSQKGQRTLASAE